MKRIQSLLLGSLGMLALVWATNLLVPDLPAQEEAKDDKAKPADTAEKTHTAKAAPFKIELELDGVLEATQMSPISLRPEVFKTLEVVKALPHGSEVKKGDTLVWLETKDLDEEIRETELAVELGELSLKSAREDLSYLEAISPLNLAQAERSRMIAQRELNQYLETDQPLAVKSAKQSLKSSEGQLENAVEELQQLEKMYKADDLTEETEEIILKRARRSVESAELFLELAKVRADRSLNETIPERQIQLSEAAQREELALAKLKVTMPVQKRQQEIALEKLERTQKKLVEKLDKLKADRKLLDVTAPASGIVYYGDCQDGKWSNIDTVAKQLQPGKTLTANQVFLTVVQLRPLQVRMSIAEKDLQHLQKGLPAEVIPTAFPNEKSSVTITSVASIPGASTKFDALAGMIEAKSRLVPGMTCKVKVVSYEKADAITVPEKAVFEENGKSYVYLADGKSPAKRPVSVGKKHDSQVEIMEGLKPGEKILTEKPKAE